MAYMVDGNLFLQDGSRQPLQLTYSGADLTPVFSDDGEKLVFYRGLIPQDLYSIDTDGTHESALVTGNLLEPLGLGYDRFTEITSLAYVPDTHQVLFNTRQLSQEDIDQKDFNRLGSKANLDLLSVNIDTGEIKSILAPGKGGNFFVSPDGKMIAIQAKGHIDVISIDGKLIRKNLVTYTPTKPYELTPGISWTEDSTELIVTLPVGLEYNMDGPETRDIWRYKIDDNAKIQVFLDPPLIGNDLTVSPDGHWILYNYYYYPDKTDETVTPGLYLGNLHENAAQLYAGEAIRSWSPDSTHFVYVELGKGLFLGRVNEKPTLVRGGGSFSDWADANHYLSYYIDNGFVVGVMRDIGGNAMYFSVGAPVSSVSSGPDTFTFTYPNR
jgi:Tol biopolymer transport system component